MTLICKVQAASSMALTLALLLDPGASAAAPPYHFDRILPTPREVQYHAPTELGSERGVVISLSTESDPHPVLIAGVEIIQEHLETLALSQPPRFGSNGSADLTVVLGTRSDEGASGENWANRPEGYRVRFREEGSGRYRVDLTGSDPRGAFYAAQTLVQLLYADQGRLMLRPAEVRDWPGYLFRCSGNDERIPSRQVCVEAVDWLPRFKINTWAVGQSYLWPENWRETPDEKLAALEVAASVVADGRMDLQFQIHPFGRADDSDQIYTIRISEESDREELRELAKAMLQAGASQILLRADDFADLVPRDRVVYGDKAAAHIDIITDLRDHLREDFPQAGILFCPPWYTGQEVDADPEKARYLENLGEALPSDVGIMWTGPEVVSETFTRGELERFASRIQRMPVLWDNTILREHTPFGYPYQYSWYYFHPIRIDLPDYLPGITPGIRFNYGFDGTQKSRVANVILAEYLWNPDAYSSEKALRDAVAVVAGAEAVDAVLTCAKALQKLFDLRHSPARLPALGPVATADEYGAMTYKLKALTPNEKLVAELRQDWFTHAATSEALTAVWNQWQQASASALLKLPMRAEGWELVLQGNWAASFDHGVVCFQFPFETESEAGVSASLQQTIQVPESATGQYVLALLSDDDYYAEGAPPEAWPGFYFRQVLVNGEVVWETDVVGNPTPEVLQIDVTDQLRNRTEVEIEVRAIDKKGVHNLGVQISFSEILLLSGGAEM